MRNMRTLTEAQRIQWETDGYIVLEGALNPDEVLGGVDFEPQFGDHLVVDAHHASANHHVGFTPRAHPRLCDVAVEAHGG